METFQPGKDHLPKLTSGGWQRKEEESRKEVLSEEKGKERVRTRKVRKREEKERKEGRREEA